MRSRIKLMLWLYNFLFPIAFFFALPLAMLKKRTRSWVLENLKLSFLFQRLGFHGANPDAALWIHAASVGEMRSLKKLLELLRKKYPELNVHMTCMTSAGLSFVRKEFLGKSLVQSASLAPLDWLPFTALYLSRMKKLKVLALAETELWPNLVFAAKRKGASLVWLNARMSYKTLRWIRRLRPFALSIFSSFDRIALSSRENISEFEKFLGSKTAVVTGNLKWDMEISGGLRDAESSFTLRSRYGWRPSDFLWTAGSVREGEEEIIIEAYKNVCARYPQLRLALVPRHLERAGILVRLLQSHGIPHTLHSRPSHAPVVVVDVLGELLPYYAASSAVFVGGTLVGGIGGHNFLEPAALAKPTVIGPYFENFREISGLFQQKHAIAVVSDGAKLEEVLAWWISHPDDARILGLKAYETFHSFQGASVATLKILSAFL